MRPLLALLAASTLVLSTAACARTGNGQPVGDPASDFRQRAVESIAAWNVSGVTEQWKHGFVPLEGLTKPVGDPKFTDTTKYVYAAGWYRLGVDAPTPRPEPGHITFPDGSTMTVALQGAPDAYRQLDQGDAPACPTGPTPDPTPTPTSTPDDPNGTISSPVIPEPCVNLTVTRIDLGTVKLLTSRGLATVPAWLFTIPMLSVPIARVAVSPSVIAEVPTVGNTLPYLRNLTAVQDLVSVDGDTVTFRLGVGSCDYDIKPLVYETSGAIALGGSFRTHNGACDAMLRLQPETVTLTAPVGDRVILDALNGNPLTVKPFDR